MELALSSDQWSLLNQFIDSLSKPTLIVGSDLEIKGYNKSASQVKEMSNKSFIQLYPILHDAFKASLSEKKSRVLESVNLLENQPDKFWDVSFSPVILPNFEGVVIEFNDISEKKNLANVVVKNDKLASLGLLLAGIAHEINNPANFVVANIEPLKKDIDDIFLILNHYQTLSPNDNIEAKLKEINDLKNEIDVDYAIDEVPRLLNGIKEGSARISTLVKSLRMFVRPDDKIMKKINIHELIDSTLNLLAHHYKNRIEIIRQFGTIPLIDCLPGKLNQVWMNLLLNAIQSIPEEGKITITTTQLNEQMISMSIKDTGLGISEENQKSLFKLFFTTKEAGTGTGLGLSISRSIIQEHKGTIDFKSQLGLGTEFIITLPIE